MCGISRRTAGWSRQFEFGGRRITIHVNADEWVGAPVLFYAEDDRFVRIYPDDERHLLSEQGEVFTLSDDGASIVTFATASRPEVLTPVSSVPGWTDEEITIDGPGGRLAGTLMKPLGPGPHPAAVMIHGAAGGRRDYYRAFAEQFVRCGVAALVYDRRGWGESTGDGDPTFSEKADDAAAWLNCLRTRPDIAADRVGVWGYSNGSWVAPMVAARHPHTAFVCVIGASGTTAVETEIHRRAFDLREQGVPAEQITWIREMWRLIYDLLLSRAPSAEHEQRFDALAKLVHASPELAGITVQEYAKQSPFLGSVPPYASYSDAVADMPSHSAATDEWTCDPVESYRKITVPVLYLVGLEDSNLPPIESASRVGRALMEAGNPNAIIVLFPNTGHGLNAGLPDTIGMNDEEAAYRMHDFRFAGGYLELIQKWIDTKVKERPASS